MRASLFRSGSGLLAAAALLTGCGGGSGSATTTVTRPATSAKLQIISPTPNQTVGPVVPLQFAVEGATVSPPDKLKLVPNEGHIHVTVDGKLVAMSYGLATTISGLSPGPHTLQAEFVANDHLPFSDRVQAAEIFNVAGGNQ